jgi:hypothetical protein
MSGCKQGKDEYMAPWPAIKMAFMADTALT